MRIAFLSTHPIQYQAPLFRVIHRRSGVHFTALFCHDHGVRPSYDPEFNQTIKYDVPLLEGYDYRFLKNVSPRPSLAPAGMINPEIISILARGEFDALVVHGYAFAAGLASLLAPRGRTRLMFRGESNMLAHATQAKKIIKGAVLSALFCGVDQFLSIGTLNTEFYRAHGVNGDRITLAPYSVDNDFFATRSSPARNDRKTVRSSLGLPNRETLFVSAAKLIAKKRPFDLLEAFARSGVSDRAGLVYVGDGKLLEELRFRVNALRLHDSVGILGFRNQTELPEIFGACDVVVLPSDFEPWGLVVNEAMACGAAAIVSDRVGAGPDLVADPRCTFQAGDVVRLARILSAVACSRDLLDELKAAASMRIGLWGLEQTADGLVAGAEAAMSRGNR